MAKVWKVGGLELPMRDPDADIRSRHFRVSDREAARDVVFGAVRAALERIGERRTPAAIGDHVTELCLYALRADPRRIAAVLAHELPRLDEDT